MILPQKGLAANASHGNMAVEHIYITRKSRRLGGHMTREEIDGLYRKYLLRMPSQADVDAHIHKMADDFERELIGCHERTHLVNLEMDKRPMPSMSSERIPLYFNYSGSRRDLLDRAIESFERHAGDLLEIRVHYSHTPRKFTRCLNEILKVNDEPYFFAHYDSMLMSREPVERMLELWGGQTLGPSWGTICHCLIYDLLMLVNPDVVRRVDGWDEAFHNSLMDMDIAHRLVGGGYKVHVMHAIEQGEGVDHTSHSSIRSCPVIKKVYTETMMRDAHEYHRRYGGTTLRNYTKYCRRTFGV